MKYHTPLLSYGRLRLGVAMSTEERLMDLPIYIRASQIESG